MKLLICLMFAVIYCNIGVESHSSHRFGYSPSEQRRWNKKHSHCSGKLQSPIAISVSKAIPLAMPAIEMIGYHNPLPGPLKMDNNGHSVGIAIPKLSKEAQEMGEFLPYVKGGKLEGEYEVEALHFHWGDKNSRGAEHVINDIRYAMEMHIIHRNKKYQDVKEAMSYPDGLSVLAFFFRTKEEDATDVGHITRYLSDITKPGEEVLLNYTFSLSSMMGKIDMDRFYTYKGSLTTPPCSESVTWVLFPDPLAVSLSQISKFRHVHSSHEGNVLVDNYRKLQPLGNRRVFLRKINPRYQSIEDPEIHYSKWGWLS